MATSKTSHCVRTAGKAFPVGSSSHLMGRNAGKQGEGDDSIQSAVAVSSVILCRGGCKKIRYLQRLHLGRNGGFFWGGGSKINMSTGTRTTKITAVRRLQAPGTVSERADMGPHKAHRTPGHTRGCVQPSPSPWQRKGACGCQKLLMGVAATPRWL